MTKEQIQEFTLRTSQANHSGLILILTDMDKIYINDALSAYEDGDMEQYHRYIELARRTHNELMSTMNMQDALARKVVATLRYIYGLLVASKVKQEPQELDRCIGMLDTLKVAFEHLHSLDEEGPVMKNTHRVYAGLTYGKGVLNESLGSTDYTNRGFKV